MKTQPLFYSLIAMASFATTACAQTTRVYFGASNSKGIYFSDLNVITGTLTPPVLAAETEGAGFIAIHPNKQFLYSTGVSAFSINGDGSLTHLNTQTTAGRDCCHVCVDRTGRCLMAAYYENGAVASFQILEDGSLSEAKSFYRHEGTGEHPTRQAGPHAHSIFPNPANTYAYASDLGIDKLMIYALDPQTGMLSDAGFAKVPGGSMGPRHLKWSADGNYAYILNELDLSISVFKPGKDAGSLEFIRTVPTLPEGVDKEAMTGAEIRIHPSGRFIYASNRDLTNQGRDSISVFTRFEDGFQRMETVPAEVWIPRNFNIDASGKWLIVAGQQSNNLALFRVDPATGHIACNGSTLPFEGSPICIEFLN